MRPPLVAFVIVVAGCGGTAWSADRLEDVRKGVEDGSSVLVDVREPRETKKGRLRHARLVPISKLRADPEIGRTLPKGKPVYLYCGAGPRARAAAEILRPLGIDARPLSQGYVDLRAFGFPEAEDEKK